MNKQLFLSLDINPKHRYYNLIPFSFHGDDVYNLSTQSDMIFSIVTLKLYSYTELFHQINADSIE